MTSLQAKLASLVKHRKMGAYIEYIRFPFYKNLRPGTRIEFSYPITALVGPNGTNKSSVLRAIMGCPEGSNLGNFWFATKLDPIVDDENNRSAFIHGHYNEAEGAVVEVVKLRISKEGNPNYWEPSRPILRYGMAKMPPMPPGGKMGPGRKKTRWDPVEKRVLYIDFRATLSAFDKFFYHGDMARRMLGQNERRELIVARAPHLKAVVEGDLKKFKFHKVQRVQQNLELPAEVVAQVGRILGKNYVAIRLVEHSFFNTVGYSAILTTDTRKYSEAFAGSGEFAVVMAVHLISSAEPNTLILMDEPEVSLHPGAQQRLVEFLTAEVDSRRHQIVMSTHSPAIVRQLPKSAIKVFAELPTGEIFVPTQESSHAEAFFGLGEPITDRIYLVVEDRLSAEIVRKILRDAGAAEMERFEIVSYPGGASSLWKRFAPVFAAQGRSDVFILFDGDQRPANPIPHSSTIPSSEDDQLGSCIKAFAGCEVEFAIDGGGQGGNKAQLIALQRQFIDWARDHVRFFPGSVCPEQFLLSKLGSVMPGTAIAAKQDCATRAAAFLGLASNESASSDDIYHWQKAKLATVDLGEPELVELRAILDTMTS